jgi:hypothetical protein
MLGFIKNLHKKEPKTDEHIFAECRQRVKKYQEKLWKRNRQLLLHNVWNQNIIMRPDFKDAYDNKNDKIISFVNDAVRYIRRDIVTCMECKECADARACALDRIQCLKEIDERFNFEYYKEYRDLETLLTKAEKIQQKESKKLDIIAAKNRYFV